MYKFNRCLLWVLVACSLSALADPTAPEYTQTLPTTADEAQVAALPTLSYIQIGQKRSAVINGQLVKVGDRIASYTVAQISARQVVLQQDDQRLVLSLFQTMKK